MKYLHLIETETDFKSSYNGDNYIQPGVSLIEENDSLNYNKYSKEEGDNFSTPLTFDIISDGNIKGKMSNGSASSDARTIKYSKDNGTTGTAITPTTSGVSIPVVSGDVIQFTGDNNAYGTTSYYNTFGASTAQFNVRGNIMSLLNSTSFNSLTTLGYQYIFKGLFRSCTGLIDASKLILPATRLATSCYTEMFRDCSSLTTAPALPATTLANSCYYNMFSGCTSLANAPVLPATTLSNNCYMGMFKNCTSLTVAPELPATTAVTGCYNGMFEGCTNLSYIKAMFTTTPSGSFTLYGVSNVKSTGTFVKNASATGNVTGSYGVPDGGTIETATA